MLLGLIFSIGTILILYSITGLVGMYVAEQKNRGAGEGFWLGFFPLGVIGIVIEALLPPGDGASPPRRYRRRRK